MSKTNYGKRGGTSVNAGKKRVVYEAVLPDGRTVRKGSFTVSSPRAFMGAYQLGGEWRVAGVADGVKDGHPVYGGGVGMGQTVIPAWRIDAKEPKVASSTEQGKLFSITIPWGDSARVWAAENWDTYGFDYDTMATSGGTVTAWSLGTDDELAKALAQDQIEFTTEDVDWSDYFD